MNGKRILLFINTPAQVHTWKNIIRELNTRGFSVKILARDYGSTLELLESEGFNYTSFKVGTSKLGRVLSIFTYLSKGYQESRKSHPDLILGWGIGEALTSKVLRKPSVIFNDTELIGIQNNLTAMTASTIITPHCFRVDLGKKQIRINSYKELAYLSPGYFTPDPSILKELGVKPGEKYVILRFNVFDAVHDIGWHGFSGYDQSLLVKELGQYARIFISPESELAPELQKYRIPIPSHRMHHALYYAQLLVADTGTMATEAAVLGTPAVRCASYVGPNDMGNFIDLEKQHDLIYSFNDSKLAVQKAVELIKTPDLKEKWAEKRQKLLSEKIDFTKYMVEFITNYLVKGK